KTEGGEEGPGRARPAEARAATLQQPDSEPQGRQQRHTLHQPTRPSELAARLQEVQAEHRGDGNSARTVTPGLGIRDRESGVRPSTNSLGARIPSRIPISKLPRRRVDSPTCDNHQRRVRSRLPMTTNRPIRVALLGSRGIPARYGGYETLM